MVYISDSALIEAQDNILYFLMDGPKGRNDFWNNNKFKKFNDDERGIYPRKMLHMMKDADLLEKFYINKRVYWRILEGAFFRLGDKEYTWSYKNPTVENGLKFEDNEMSILDKPVNALEMVEEIENDEFPYLEKAKKALEEPKKSWLKKLKLW